MSKKNNLMEKIQSKLPFGKKKAEPETEVANQTEITDGSGIIIRKDRPVDYQFASPELTFVPASYFDMVHSDLFAKAKRDAKDMVENLNLGVQHAPVMDKLMELQAARIAVNGLVRYRLTALRQAYEDMIEAQRQLDELQSYIRLRQKQLDEIHTTIHVLEH